MKTIVPRFTVRMPIRWPRSDWRRRVNRTALEQVASIPRKMRRERNMTAIVRPNRNSAARLKERKSCTRLRWIISTT
jgi:hypothetical protein